MWVSITNNMKETHILLYIKEYEHGLKISSDHKPPAGKISDTK